jgi:predicted acylesterase/phospholipase RssA
VRALVLSGGGACGAFSAGVVAALCESETFDLVCGTSIGAINGALVAQDDSALLREIWHNIASRGLLQLEPALDSWRKLADDVRHARLLNVPLDLFRLRIPSLHLMGLMSWEPTRKLMTEHKHYENLRRALIVSTTNITLESSEAFYYFPGHPEAGAAFAAREPTAHPLTPENYLDAVCASAAIPGVFPAVAIDVGAPTPQYFADGMIANNTPIRQAIDAGATEITVIFHQHRALRPSNRTVHSLPELILVGQDIADQHVLELDLKLARAVNGAVLRGEAPEKRFVDLRVIGPAVPLGLRALGFDDANALDRAFTIGYEQGREIAAAHIDAWLPMEQIS